MFSLLVEGIKLVESHISRGKQGEEENDQVRHCDSEWWAQVLSFLRKGKREDDWGREKDGRRRGQITNRW